MFERSNKNIKSIICLANNHNLTDNLDMSDIDDVLVIDIPMSRRFARDKASFLCAFVDLFSEIDRIMYEYDTENTLKNCNYKAVVFTSNILENSKRLSKDFGDKITSGLITLAYKNIKNIGFDRPNRAIIIDNDPKGEDRKWFEKDIFDTFESEDGDTIYMNLPKDENELNNIKIIKEKILSII